MQHGVVLPRFHARPRARGFLRWALKVPPLFYRIGFARWLGSRLLLLTTTGRRSGKPRTVGLNYAVDGDTIYVLSGFGLTDWYRNLVIEPRVAVQIGTKRWVGEARPVIDPEKRRHARAVVRAQGSGQGPPKALRPLFARFGLDYEAELRMLDDPSLDRPAVAIRRTG